MNIINHFLQQKENCDIFISLVHDISIGDGINSTLEIFWISIQHLGMSQSIARKIDFSNETSIALFLSCPIN